MEVCPNCCILPFTSSYSPLHESGLHWTKYWLLAELSNLKTGYGFVALSMDTVEGMHLSKIMCSSEVVVCSVPNLPISLMPQFYFSLPHWVYMWMDMIM